jgi:hypothetical protein
MKQPGMYEKHENEQYFFEPGTLNHLADFVQQFENPCCLCAPMLGTALEARGVKVRVLDIDERFATLAGFLRYNIYKPQWLDEEFGLILCDPPFFNISLAQLFKTIRLLSHNQYTQPILVSYLTRRSANLMGTFSNFGLNPTGYMPDYRTVQKLERNEIEFYGNLGEGLHQKLANIT